MNNAPENRKAAPFIHSEVELYIIKRGKCKDVIGALLIILITIIK